MALRRMFPWRLLFLVIGVCWIAACAPMEDDKDSPRADDPDLITGETAVVVDIIDGDTIDVRMGGDVYRVRYVGVNTPERDEPCYYDATSANADLVDGQTVTLVQDVSETDQYGRLLRYVYVGDIFVNAELVAAGYAESNAYQPDTAYYDYLEDLETRARQQGLGCHPTGVFR
ncbi:MAG: thermonuclease family protein [Chloroflexi bacterium]|nr:thermonuclease family protein [Chloroflexota bacterium]